MTMRQVIDDLNRMQDAFRAVKDACNKMRDAEINRADRRANQAHRERIHAEIEADIDLEFDEADRGADWSHTVTQAIAAGRIRHLTINY